MSTPVIGITSTVDRARSNVWDLQAVFLPWNYGEGVLKAGAAVTVAPEQPPRPDAVAAVLDGFDGLMVTGGADIDAALYGQQPHPANDQPHPERDAWEIALVREALARGLPFLGICRGAQVLNVARGGNLIQHLPDVLGHEAHGGHDDTFGAVEVQTVPGSRVAAWYGERATVPVYHHQAIDRPGEGLDVTARSVYGIVEAVEDPRGGFCVAVQWHPEAQERCELWEAFVEAARVYRAGRRQG